MKKVINKALHFTNDRFLLPVANKFKKFYEKYYFNKLRKELKNKDFSLFSPNCYAGLIYHRLGLQFNSPTINLYFPIKKHYLKFVSNIRYYLSKDLIFIHDPEYTCPVAMLEDIKIVFNHYDTNENAKSSWDKRKQRVNYDNVFIIFDDIADVEYSDLLAFNSISCKGKVILTAKKYENLQNTVQITRYKKSEKMNAYLLDKNIWTGKNVADKNFNFVKWLNTSKI